ncbi:hypothetical protein DAERI_200011 [Deinococcus aerius]|uniref:Uncharacterized protein n=1 Tax=Deinococcus aerius TaxID=200253 RepID=A0A2I9D0A4_9DEIO|nr:hypothetical protein [Deinococcus aerius]GBF07954.1 hypothetical protein DAERI_200011 [Deinococcus aerius]
MSSPTDLPSDSPQGAGLLGAALAWQRGETTRDALLGPLTRLGHDEGGAVHDLIGDLIAWAPPSPDTGDRDADRWRAELMACRARTWASPASAGLLVGPTVLILTDGGRGVVLDPSGTRPLPGSISASLLLLCQTIVMADNAVDAQELGKLRQQRIESSSTSLSEIKPVH